MKSLTNRIISLVFIFVKSYPAVLAATMILIMGALGYGSMIGNSAIVDEVAHIPSAYSYIHYGDYRLNPEHPPLIKDLAGIPLQFLNVAFPLNEPGWTSETAGQWDTGWNFLYHLGNNADQILYWARLPILVLTLAFGATLFVIVRRRWGDTVSLLALFLYCLSPNIIAHSSLVTTDVGASIFIFLALVAYAHFAEKPSKASTGLLGLALAGAELAKFSAIILYPFLLCISVALVLNASIPSKVGARIRLYVGGLAAASGISLLIVWIVYGWQVRNMPLEVQDRLISGALKGPYGQNIGHWLLSVNHLPLIKPLAHYVLGLVMVSVRIGGGNVTYFNGQVTNQSFHTYFFELFILKTQIPLLILMIILTAYAAWRFRRNGLNKLAIRASQHFAAHVLEWTLGLFAAFFFTISVVGNLNLGIRHILPIYVPIFVLVAIGSVKIMRVLIAKGYTLPTVAFMAALLIWYGASTVLNYPNYLSYFNEFIGGGANAGHYFSDSSVDWGQDLKRLKTYTANHPEIHHLAVDYFGGSVPAYYFCVRRLDASGQLVATESGYDCSHSVYEPWHAEYGKYTGQYIAVSETFLENDRYYAVFQHRSGYDYLRALTPIARVGNSIYVYKMY
jgi:hypothetical protein